MQLSDFTEMKMTLEESCGPRDNDEEDVSFLTRGGSWKSCTHRPLRRRSRNQSWASQAGGRKHCIDRKGDSPRSMDRKGNGEKEREGRKIYFFGGKGREIAACFSSFHLMARPPRRVENNRRKRLESRAKSVDNRRRYFSPTDWFYCHNFSFSLWRP